MAAPPAPTNPSAVAERAQEEVQARAMATMQSQSQMLAYTTYFTNQVL